MNTNTTRIRGDINLSSLIIGFLLAVCLMLASGAFSGSRADSEGPYQIATGSDAAVFVIDTQTGQTWQLSRSDNIDFGTPFDRKSSRKFVTPMVN